MFTIDSTPLKRGFNPMPAGTNNNCVLKRIAYEPFKANGTGDKVLKFEFTNDKGQIFTHNEWEIIPEKVKSNAHAWGKDYKDLLEEMMRDTTERIKHIMSCYMPLSDITVKGANYQEFSQAVIDNLNDRWVDVPVRLKLILNQKDFTVFPRRALNDFILLMSDNDTFVYHQKYERITPKASANSDDLNAMLGGEPAPFDADPAPVLTPPVAAEDSGLEF